MKLGKTEPLETEESFMEHVRLHPHKGLFGVYVKQEAEEEKKRFGVCAGCKGKNRELFWFQDSSRWLCFGCIDKIIYRRYLSREEVY